MSAADMTPRSDGLAGAHHAHDVHTELGGQGLGFLGDASFRHEDLAFPRCVLCGSRWPWEEQRGMPTVSPQILHLPAA